MITIREHKKNDLYYLCIYLSRLNEIEILLPNYIQIIIYT